MNKTENEQSTSFSESVSHIKNFNFFGISSIVTSIWNKLNEFITWIEKKMDFILFIFELLTLVTVMEKAT